MKKYFALLTLGLAFCLLASDASAQMTFTNNTPCWVRVRGTFTNVAPCVAPYCTTPWISVPPFGVGFLPGMPCAAIPGPPSFFRRLQINDGLGGLVTIDYCTAPVMNYLDCNLAPRVVQFTSPMSAVTF